MSVEGRRRGPRRMASPTSAGSPAPNVVPRVLDYFAGRAPAAPEAENQDGTQTSNRASQKTRSAARQENAWVRKKAARLRTSGSRTRQPSSPPDEAHGRRRRTRVVAEGRSRNDVGERAPPAVGSVAQFLGLAQRVQAAGPAGEQTATTPAPQAEAPTRRGAPPRRVVPRVLGLARFAHQQRVEAGTRHPAGRGSLPTMLGTRSRRIASVPLPGVAAMVVEAARTRHPSSPPAASANDPPATNGGFASTTSKARPPARSA